MKRVKEEVSVEYEMTEVSRRVLKAGGPSLLFEKPAGFSVPVVTNLFASRDRIAAALGLEQAGDLRGLGEFLATLKEPSMPKDFSGFVTMGKTVRSLMNMREKRVSDGPCRETVYDGDAVDLGMLPVQTCWPGDAGPLITWGAVATAHPVSKRINLGIYRMQVIGKNRVIMRWLAHRGGALDFRTHAAQGTKPFPVAVAIGCDPATLLSAVIPVPDTLSEYAFAGLLRSARTETVAACGGALAVPATAEIVLEGEIMPDASHRSGFEHALEGPFGDHTGYMNEPAEFPVLTVKRISMRKNPLYLSTFTCRPPDEPSVLGSALNELFVPLLKKQFPEIEDFYLPADACSYRIAVVSLKKAYPGHARRIMFGIWSFLRQFLYTKTIIVIDAGLNVKSMADVLWAVSTCADPVRDTVLVENTPVDSLDFSSPVEGLGGKMGIDATTKWPGETQRAWPERIRQTGDIAARVDELMKKIEI